VNSENYLAKAWFDKTHHPEPNRRAKTPSLEGQENSSYELFSSFFPTFAVLASLREILRVSVAAAPRWVLRGEKICALTQAAPS
jgi:hypothetical protein